MGYLRVFERNGRRAFNISVHLSNLDELLELLEPGTKAKLESRAKSSWWNRELF
jgi:hypothetical protein